MRLICIINRARQVALVLQMRTIHQEGKEILVTRSVKATAIAPLPPQRLDPRTPRVVDLNRLLFYNNRHSQSGKQILIR